MGLGQVTLEAMEEEESHLEKCVIEVPTDIIMKIDVYARQFSVESAIPFLRDVLTFAGSE